MRSPQTLLMVLFLFLVVFTARSVLQRQDQLFEKSKDLPEVLHLIDSAYVDRVDLEKLMPGAFQGALERMDPNAVYLAPGDPLVDMADKAFRQTGLILTKKNRYAMAVTVAPGSPAYEAGLRDGDYLRRIGGLSTRETNLLQIRRLLAESTQDIAVVAIDRLTGDDRDFSIRPGSYAAVKLTAASYLDGLNLITLPGFYPQAGEDLDRAMTDIEKDQKVILDLRHNALGDDAALLLLASRFLPAGPVATWTGAESEDLVISNTDQGKYFGTKLYILLDESTSQAAEVFAAAARLSGVAVVVGSPTRGHSGHYRFMPLQNGGHVYMASRHLMLGDGNYLHKSKVEPDLLVETAIEREEDDPFLQKALEQVRSHEAG